MGSSPLTRGAPISAAAIWSGMGIIPAYAGSTNNVNAFAVLCWDHPRLRGEHISFCSSLYFFSGSSPLTRGAPVTCCSWRSPLGIIPAYAGSTVKLDSVCAVLADHPRLRGEHPVTAAYTCCAAGSSPLTRGAPLLLHQVCVRFGIIPAYAGSTSRCTETDGTGRDHPRLRGEHSSSTGSPREQKGSSPLTRGALKGADGRKQRFGIIPAYAGSTP